MADIIRLKRIAESQESQIKLDLYDKKLIFSLSQDSRMPLSTLAKKLKLSRDTLQYKVDRLLKKGVILRFVPIVDLTQFGFMTFHVFLVIDEGSEKRFQELIKSLEEHPNTKDLMEYTGNWELEWVLVARSVQEFDSIFNEVTTKFSDVILEKQKIEIIKGYKSEQVPSKLYDEPVKIKQSKKTNTTFDKKDIQLLKLLSKDARQSSYDLAKALKLAPNTVRYRIKNLEDAGIIRKFSIVVNLAMLDFHWYSVSIKLKTMTKQDESKLKEFVDVHPYILRAVTVLGPFDLLLNIATGSIRDFHSCIKEFQSLFGNIMVSYQSLIGYQEHVFENIPDAITLD